MVPRDRQAWHEGDEDPASSLPRHLETVRRLLARVLREQGDGPDGPVRLLSLCAGDGRDTLPGLPGLLVRAPGGGL